ncbi:MAG TPA: periplasmic heavy metal sensor [Caulobacteraceae bacterium]|jgi:uncharacterized membrane protein
MSQRALGIGLFISIAFNAFLAAAFIGALSLAGYVAHHPAAPVMRQAAQSLDRTHRAAFIAMLHQQGQSVRPMNREAHALRREVWEAMQQPGFDPASAKLKLSEARTQTIAARASVEDAFVDFAATLPADQRAALGRALEHITPRGHAGPPAGGSPMAPPDAAAPG